MVKLTKEEILQYKEAYKAFDIDGTGRITPTVLKLVLRSLGEDFSEDDLKNILANVDTNHDGVISLSEFLAMMERYKNNVIVDKEEELRLSFGYFDRNNDGFISPHELSEALADLGEYLTDEEINKMFRAADLNGDGLIDYKEFLNITQGRLN